MFSSVRSIRSAGLQGDPEQPNLGDGEVAQSSAADSVSQQTSMETSGSFKSRTYMHPDDSMHKHWYETTVRLRGTYFVFFSLAVNLALSLGITTELFFSVMATPESDAVSFGVVMGILLIPILLLVTAIYVDEILDIGLDAMDLPAFGLVRATITTSISSICQGFTTCHAEKALLLAFEGTPCVVGILTVALSDTKTHWYKDFARGYCLGGLIFAILVGLVYIISHIHVGHNPSRDERMSVTYHHMGHIGEFKQVQEQPSDQSNISEASHFGRCVSYVTVACALEVLVVLLFIAFHKFYLVFLGQLLATVLLALSVRAFAPRLLGKAFWITFVFFILLTVGLLAGTLAQTNNSAASAAKKGKTLQPLAYGPDAAGYGEDMAEYGDLPLKFQLSNDAPHPGYPICGTRWGFDGMSEENKFGILDLASLAFASSFKEESQIRDGLYSMFHGTELEDWKLLEVENSKTVGRWIVIEFPKQKARVISVRGTSSLEDAYADLELYASVAVLQMMSIMTPVLSLLPVPVTQALISGNLARTIFGNENIVERLFAAVEKHKEWSKQQGETLLMTGHSLGGALVGAASANSGIEGIGFSAPGLYYQAEKYGLKWTELQYSFTIVQPTMDVVPRVDKQRGMIEWIECNLSPGTCHRLTHTSCELWAQCGDARDRDWRETCSPWYTKSMLNHDV